MPRPSIPKEQKKREGAYLEARINDAKIVDPGITQESIALEIGITQGNVSQWMKGTTAIPDKHLIWLGRRLGFNPAEIRPSLKNYSISAELSTQEETILKAYRLDPNFRRSVDSIAQMSQFYELSSKHHDKSS